LAVNEVRVTRVIDSHVAELSRTMRSAEVEEVWVASRHTPLEALQDALVKSDLTRALLFDGKVAALFGVCITAESALGGPVRGLMWVLTGEPVNRAPREYLIWTRRLLRQLLDYCPCLFNFIDARYAEALHWARWLGFEALNKVSAGPRGHPFIHVEIRR
jgi:hypothetical protein